MTQDLDDLAQEATLGGPGPPSAARKRYTPWWSGAKGRWTKRVGGLALALFLVAGLLGGWHIQRYRPIERGSYGRYLVFEHRQDNAISRDDILEINPITSQDEIMIRFRPGGFFLYGFSLRNDGRWPITITSFPELRYGAERFVLRENLQMGLGNDVIGAQPLTGFRPFRLGPGEERYLEIEYRMSQCASTPEGLHDGAVFGWGTQQVDYEVFGFSRRMEVELLQEVLINYTLDGVPADCRS